MASLEVDGAHFSPDTRAFLRLLHEADVRYLIVGGEAVIFHGRVRLTGDVDFFVANDGDNAARLFSVLQEFWDGDVPGVEGPGDLTADDLIIQFGMPPNRIDLMTSIAGVGFEEAWAGRVEANMVDGARATPVPYMGVDALVKNKKAAARPKDLDDLEFFEPAG